MISKAIQIASWVIEQYEGIKKFVTTKYRTYRSRKIRTAVDKRDTNTIKRIVQSIIKKRQDRQDSV